MKAPWKSKNAIPIMIVMLIAIIALIIFIGIMILQDFKIPDNYTQTEIILSLTQLETQSETETSKQTELPTETESETAAETLTESETQTETISESETADGNTDDSPLVVIDPGHQGPGQDMSQTEANGPGSDVMKAKLAVGTYGRTTGLNEYELTLDISLLLKTELESRGYRVIMTRTTHDINIGNIERAQIANDAGADALIRIHANGSEDSSVSGALTMSPSASNPYVSNLYDVCRNLSSCIIDAYCAATGLENDGVLEVDDMTGINWSQVPVTILEMGFMTNTEDDLYMANTANYETMVRGIANGLDTYFGRSS